MWAIFLALFLISVFARVYMNWLDDNYNEFKLNRDKEVIRKRQDYWRWDNIVDTVNELRADFR